MRQQPLTIGRLANLANVGVETIRYYQNFGLLQEPAKPRNGYRQYPKDALQRLQFIKRAQELGFTLKEIAKLLELGDSRCLETRALAAEKLQVIHSRIADLLAVRSTLEELIRRCDANSDPCRCPLLGALSGDSTLL